MHILGIMTGSKSPRPRFWDRYRSAAQQENFDDIIVFTPSSVNLSKQCIQGFVRNSSGWEKTECPLPSIVHDIGYYSNRATIRKVKQIKANPSIPFVGYALGNKWRIHKQLLNTSIRPFLLPTKLAKTTDDIFQMVRRYRTVMIKPLNGKGGKGIIKFSEQPDKSCFFQPSGEPGYSFKRSEAAARLEALLAKRRYLIQQWIDIRDEHERTNDVRILLQKNGLGKWIISAQAIRHGKDGEITSNLKSGGTAEPLEEGLAKRFNDEDQKAILKQVERLSRRLPKVLERVYGKRFCELGVDLAIDRKQRVWLIEVNIKPGKSVLQLFGPEAMDAGFRAPIQYARHLLEKNKIKT
ncbi:YheC/YheD family protein [Paenibacillus turpanensis]|uniref:YheC/YheD family endospore coat-associated protein n=1 Tax=Paenibacillus turpanensis TaxID=2689078 RepID=UPI00140AE0EA|nr:YheC/YheD family protein [Paenibacillus turpanensis]